MRVSGFITLFQTPQDFVGLGWELCLLDWVEKKGYGLSDFSFIEIGR